MKKETSYGTVARTWKISKEANEIKNALEVLVAAAHGKNAKNIIDATKLIQKRLITNSGIVDIMIAASDWSNRERT
jgi:DNA-binding protein